MGVAAGLAGALALTLAACGSDSSDDAKPTSTSTGLTGEPVKVMVISPLSGPSQTIPWMSAAVKAAAQAINKAGGINGRPVEVTACDDKFDPNEAAKCANQAVEGKYLFVTGNSGFGDRYMPILEKAKIPAIGNVPNSSSEMKSPYSFPFSASVVSVAGGGTVCGKLEKKAPASAVVDVTAARDLAKLFALGLKPFNLPAPKNVPIPPTAADLSTYAGNLSDVDCVEAVLGVSQTTRLIQALRQAGNNAVIAYGSTDVNQQTIDSLGAAANNVVLVSPGSTVADTSDPAVKRFLDEATAAGVDTKTLTDGSMIAWAATHYVAEQAKKLPTIDGASLADALTKAGPIDYAPLPKVDFSKPVTFVFEGNRIFSTNVVLSEIKDGKRTPLFGGQAFNVLAP